jgi:hypothetical protein
MPDAEDDNDDEKSIEDLTAREAIPRYLLEEGRSTVHEIATALDYSHGHIRSTAKELKEEGTIQGEKTKPVVGCWVNGMSIILTGNRDGIIRQLRQCAPSAAEAASGMTVEELHNHIKEIADVVYSASQRWEFWINPDDVASVEELQDEAEV